MRLCAHSPPAWAHTSPSPPPRPQPPRGTPARGLQTTWQPPCSQPRRGEEPPPQTWQELLGKVSSIQPGRLYRTEPVIRDIGPRSAQSQESCKPESGSRLVFLGPQGPLRSVLHQRLLQPQTQHPPTVPAGPLPLGVAPVGHWVPAPSL